MRGDSGQIQVELVRQEFERLQRRERFIDQASKYVAVFICGAVLGGAWVLAWLT